MAKCSLVSNFIIPLGSSCDILKNELQGRRLKNRGVISLGGVQDRRKRRKRKLSGGQGWKEWERETLPSWPGSKDTAWWSEGSRETAEERKGEGKERRGDRAYRSNRVRKGNRRDKRTQGGPQKILREGETMSVSEIKDGERTKWMRDREENGDSVRQTGRKEQQCALKTDEIRS